MLQLLFHQMRTAMGDHNSNALRDLASRPAYRSVWTVSAPAVSFLKALLSTSQCRTRLDIPTLQICQKARYRPVMHVRWGHMLNVPLFMSTAGKQTQFHVSVTSPTNKGEMACQKSNSMMQARLPKFEFQTRWRFARLLNRAC